MCTAGAAKMRGTVLYDLLDESAHEKKEFRLGHPGGIMSIDLEIEENDKGVTIREASAGRTARRLMDGFVYVPESCFKGS
jgi:2-methylaconitate cis-trans-isomerase PrpF